MQYNLYLITKQLKCAQSRGVWHTLKWKSL